MLCSIHTIHRPPYLFIVLTYKFTHPEYPHYLWLYSSVDTISREIIVIIVYFCGYFADMFLQLFTFFLHVLCRVPPY